MYQIISDGSCDLGNGLDDQFDIEVVPFYVTLDGSNYQKEQTELKVRDFYEFLVAHPKVFPKTSMPAIEDYYQVFEKYARKGIDILCLCITTKFSGSFNAANLAKEMILEKYPNIKVEVIDTRINTVLQGLLCIEAARYKRQGASLEQCVAKINELIPTGRILFTIDSMDYLVHGGRVGKLSGIAANVFGLRPLIILKDGEIFSDGVVRGRKRSITKLINNISTYIETNQINLKEYIITIGYGYDIKEAEKFKMYLESRLYDIYPDANIDLPIRQIGATIGVHTGPLPLGIGIIKKHSA